MSGPVSKEAVQDKSADRGVGRPQEQTREREGTSLQADVLALQRSAGNYAVNQLLHPSAENSSDADNSVPPIVEDVLKSGGGQPLDGATQEFMSNRLGKDFRQVRVHIDANAAESAEAINANAYTAGTHIVFGPGQYQPWAGTGKQLLAHELSHVLQQTNSSTVEHRLESLPGHSDPLEREASRIGEQLGHVGLDNQASYQGVLPAKQNSLPSAGKAVIQRQKKPGGKARVAEGPLAISHFENDFRTVVFNHPVSLGEAKQFIWRLPPHDPKAITPDPAGVESGGKYSSFHVDVRYELQGQSAFVQFSDSFRKIALESLPRKGTSSEQLEQQGLPREIAEVAPSLRYKEREVEEVYEVSRLHALHARIEHYFGHFVQPWEQTAGTKVIRRVVSDFDRFPGVWMVHGKPFPGDWLVRVRSGIVEAWQLKPGLDAYLELYNGDEEKARRQHNAAATRESYVLRYWEEGLPLDDAMGMMRSEVEIDFKSGVWSAAGTVQAAAGVMSHKPALERPTYSDAEIGAATNRAIKNTQIRAGESALPMRQSGQARPIGETTASTAKSARLRDEAPASTGMRARPREEQIPGRAQPRRDTGKSTPPPKVAEQRLATGTGDISAESPASVPAPVQVIQSPWRKSSGETGVPPVVASAGPGKKPTQQAPSQKPTTTSLPVIGPAKPVSANTQKSQQKARPERIRETEEGEFYPDPRVRGHANEQDACDRLGLVQLASNTQTVDAYHPGEGTLKKGADPNSGKKINILENGHYYQMKSRETMRYDTPEKLDGVVMKALEELEAFPAEGVYSRQKGDVPLLIRNPEKKTLVWIFDEAHVMDPKSGGDKTRAEVMKMAEKIAKSKDIELRWYRRTMGGDLVPGS